MKTGLNRNSGLFQPGQIVNYDYWDGLSNDHEKVKLLLLSKIREAEESVLVDRTPDAPVVWRAYYLTGNRGRYKQAFCDDLGRATGLAHTNRLVLVFEYAIDPIEEKVNEHI